MTHTGARSKTKIIKIVDKYPSFYRPHDFECINYVYEWQTIQLKIKKTVLNEIYRNFWKDIYLIAS